MFPGNVRKQFATKGNKRNKQVDRKNHSNKSTRVEMAPKEQNKRLTLQQKWCHDCNDKRNKTGKEYRRCGMRKMNLKREERNDLKFVSTEKSNDTDHKRKKIIG